MRRLMLVMATACGSSPGLPADLDLEAEVIATGLRQPIAIEVPPGESRFFVAEKGGRIAIVENGARARDFLDIHTLVSTGNEQGLLGMAFHPDYATNRRFFVHYTDTGGDSHVVEYRAADASTADPSSAFEILTVGQPFANHNGGHVTFGPDRKLYIGFGDGGSGFDPQGNGQSLDTRLGKILRIDVDVTRPMRYAVPPDNPFPDGEAPEIWVYGLRNPWRFTFDRDNGDLWIGDVGQEEWEEIDLVPAGTRGQNFGWSAIEGNDHCPRSPDQTCTMEGDTAPVHDYNHDIGNAVVGGFVYRGERIPALRGAYVFSDNGGGFVRAIRWEGSFVPMDQAVIYPALAQPAIASFGEDADGEIVFCSLSRGTCSRIIKGG